VIKLNNAIVYSFHIREKTILENRCYKQLLYSIKTLRQFNKDIKVYVYVAPFGMIDNIYIDDNVEFIEFDNTDQDGWPEAWTTIGYQEFLRHRWENALRTISDKKLDNILYLDTDTIFFNNVNILFEKYGNSEYVWAKPDNSEHIMKQIGIWPGMNDGQFILSNKVDTTTLLYHINIYISNLLKNNKSTMGKQDYLDLCWISVQYAVFDYFLKEQKPVKYFDEFDVMLHLEPEYKDTSNLILQHYYNGNFTKVVPKEYW